MINMRKLLLIKQLASQSQKFWHYCCRHGSINNIDIFIVMIFQSTKLDYLFFDNIHLLAKYVDSFVMTLEQLICPGHQVTTHIRYVTIISNLPLNGSYYSGSSFSSYEKAFPKKNGKIQGVNSPGWKRSQLSYTLTTEEYCHVQRHWLTTATQPMIAESKELSCDDKQYQYM